MGKTVEREGIIFRIIIFIATCGIVLLSNSLSALADSSLNTYEKDPFFGEKIIDPSWGLSKTDPSWDPSQPWYHQILDDWSGPARPQYIRGETWMGTQNYPDKDHVASTTIQYAVYRFGTEKAAQQYLESIFKKEKILKVQDSAEKFRRKKLTEISAQLKKNVGPWKTYAIGGMAVPNSSDCQRDNYMYGGESFRLLSVKDHSYAIYQYAYKSRYRTITEVNKARREYRIVTEGSIGERFVSDEKRGIYIRKREYILLVIVSASRITQWDVGIRNGCNFQSTAKEVPFREDIWSHVMSLQGTGISITKLAPDSDKDGVPDNIDKCPNTKAGVTVDGDGCPVVKMQMSLGTDKNIYSPGETVIINGSVWDAKGGLNGAAVVVDVDGTRLTATAHSTKNYAGKYECKFSLPASSAYGKHTVKATASYSSYPGSISKSTTFIVGESKIKIETEKIIPVPGEIPVTVTALDQIGNPIKGIVRINLVDKNNKEIHFAQLKETTGYTLDDRGQYSTKLKIWNPGERKLKWSMGYTHLKDIPLTATIKVEILDKKQRPIAKKEEIVPFNLALVHGSVVENKTLQPIQEFSEPKIEFTSRSFSPRDLRPMFFHSEKSDNGNFQVMLKPYNFKLKKSLKDLMGDGVDVALKWGIIEPFPLIYSIENFPQAGKILNIGKVSKTPLDLIKKWYVKFGTSPHTWPDDTTEKKPLTGPFSNGAVNNFRDLLGNKEASRFNCVAMQYKTLWFLYHIRNKKIDVTKSKFLLKLKGWGYSAAYGVAAPIYPEHNVVALWERVKEPVDNTLYGVTSDVTILDSHGKQKAYWYKSNTVIFEWHIDRTTEPNYIDKGWIPPWYHKKSSSTEPMLPLRISLPDTPVVSVACPVNLIVTNTKNQRLGILPNGKMIAEFKPVDSYFWQDKKGDKQWYFALPKDTYTINIIGTGSGSFNLLAYTPGKGVYDYGENPINTGEKASLIMRPGKEDELTLANGKKVLPTSISPTQPQSTGQVNQPIPSTADAYVYAYNYRNWDRSNRGKYDQLRAGWHPTGGESRAYIKFDLSRTDAGKVNKAILKLYHLQTSGNNGVKLGIYRVTSPWNEGTDTYHSGRTEKTAPPGDISWVQQPTINATPVATFNPGTRMRDWIEVDITPLIKQWLSGMPNYGLVIKPIGHLGRNVSASTYHFASRERDPNLDKPQGENKAPTLILSADNSQHKNRVNLRGGYATIRNWDKTYGSFDFALGKVISKEGSGDFFIADRGQASIIHVFDSPGIIDIGETSFDRIKKAPVSGYKETAKPIKGHCYIIRSKGKYGKILIENILKSPAYPITEYKIAWALLPNTTRQNSTPIRKNTTNQHQTTNTNSSTDTGEKELKRAYQEYIASYNRLTALSAKGKDNTEEGQAAYRSYIKAKAKYERLLSKRKIDKQPYTPSTQHRSKAVIYREYIAAYQRYMGLVSQGKRNTTEAREAFKEYEKLKKEYEAAIRKY